MLRAMSEAPAIPAATVLLLRDGADGLEVFMVLRHERNDSFAGALVFPGGKVDPRDRDPGLSAFSRGADAAGFRVAAIREAFEECGVLLARDARTGAPVDAARLAKLEPRWRAALHAGASGVLEMACPEALELACDALLPFSHWITPKTQPRIFDTHFFLAAAPPDHVALHDGGENTDSVWISPARALAEQAQGLRRLVFPTFMNLRRLSAAGSVADALALARTIAVVPVQPVPSTHPRGRLLRIPREAGYGCSEVVVDEAIGRFEIVG
jgi:8-oxo-dGTP pyrophosphatase MutT (NUDIX family)